MTFIEVPPKSGTGNTNRFEKELGIAPASFFQFESLPISHFWFHYAKNIFSLLFSKIKVRTIQPAYLSGFDVNNYFPSSSIMARRLE